MANRSAARLWLLAIFVLSGFAGLIYQSVWSHYLGLFLGHAAYAQALVLALFMGGMAVGSAWIARVGTRWRNLLRGYAVVELVIGTLGLAFHWIFTHATAFGYDTLIPMLDSAPAVAVVKWGLASLLILPQTILLGMTFPLMSGGLIRRFPGQDGDTLGGLYFTNSIGAAIGALVSVFVLIPAVGLPGTTITAGLLNFAVAALAWRLGHATESPPAPTAAQDAGQGLRQKLLYGVLLATAISGAASFVYEITWIRMLSLAVGSTQHAFELMLASFIAGIAFGGLWVRKRADSSPVPLRLAGWMQVAMGLAALASLVLYANSFEWVGWLVKNLPPSNGGYVLFNLGTAAVAIAIMLPAAFFAGTTLPLFTVALLRAGFGERSIGRVYAWNTLGAIVGVFFAIHFLIPFLGLKLALSTAALIDMAVGLVLLRSCADSRREMARFAGAGLAAAVALGLAVTQVPFDPLQLASGVFRNGHARLDPSNRVVFYRDGKTASVSVIASQNGLGAIATNGKVDAGLSMRPEIRPVDEELTMRLAAALPLAMLSSPTDVGIIGFGSGLTTHTALGDSRVRRVDTVEIEPAMVQGAMAFMPQVSRAYTDPRSHIVIDDAKAWFAGRRNKYDIIISEPSNPWVSGVASLFSKEFYRFIPRHLKPDGLFVQWVQLYEIDDHLVSSILNTLTPEFGDYAAWLSSDSDLIIVATLQPQLPPVDYSRVLRGVLGTEFSRLGITSREQLAFHKVADARLLRALGREYGGEENSDYYPYLSLEAPRTRFMRLAAGGFTGLTILDQPVLEMLGIRHALPTSIPLPLSDLFTAEQRTVEARQRAAFLLDPASATALDLDTRARLTQFLTLAARCPDNDAPLRGLLEHLNEIAGRTMPYLPADALAPVWHLPVLQTCRLSSPAFDHALALIESTSSRDPQAMKAAGEAWFSLRQDGAYPEAETMDGTALLALLAADAAQGNWEAVCNAHRRLGARIPMNENEARARNFLLAMAAGELRPEAAAHCNVPGQ
ncbi:MAG: fused MFS/spermidine synthase [Thermomonas sp.]|uniref:fused MFS/spermidine synthase n=1 Tax=Thermomonas sp. TaxID=1971895 RepID=UPI001D28E5C2|nr:fused MFS/spermidine synthase [Thermomonas sp.]MBZ0088496.1 fused MFS/spermidine synthase [Thermomonas sp.]